MTYKIRQNLYTKISELRKRPLVVYVTSHRTNASAQISSDVIPEIIRQIESISDKEENIDFLIISLGGDPNVSYRVISILREKFKHISVLIPFMAYSAATLISLGADEIIMHPFSNLGPVDPQLSQKKQNNEQFTFGSEDLRNYIQFLREDLGLTDQEQIQKSFENICKEVGAVPIGIAKRSSQLALSLGEKMLSMHLKDGNKAKSIAETLNKSFYHHGYPLGRTEAKSIGLPVVFPELELEKSMWEIYESFAEEMLFNKPFSAVEEVTRRPENAPLLAPPVMVEIPTNLDPGILNQVYQQIVQQAARTINIPTTDYELYQASVESVSGRSEYRTKGKILASRLPDNNISINLIPTEQGWKHFPNTPEKKTVSGDKEIETKIDGIKANQSTKIEN